MVSCIIFIFKYLTRLTNLDVTNNKVRVLLYFYLNNELFISIICSV